MKNAVPPGEALANLPSMIPTTYVSESVKKYVESRQDKEYKYISPSSLGGCLRAHYYKLKGVKATTPPSTAAQTNFMVGRVWEAFVAKCLQENGRLVKWYRDGKDKPFYLEKLNLGGLPDFLVKGEAGLVILDAKTMRSDWYWYRNTKSTQQIMLDDHSYQLQGACYIILLRSAGIDVKRGGLAFASKDDGFIGSEYEFELTPELEEEVEERCRKLNTALKTNTLPPCECEGWKIGYCDFGNPLTRKKNKKGKEVNTECCSPSLLKTDPLGTKDFWNRPKEKEDIDD